MFLDNFFVQYRKKGQLLTFKRVAQPLNKKIEKNLRMIFFTLRHNEPVKDFGKGEHP